MALSGLQKYILRTAYRFSKSRVPRQVFNGFYKNHDIPRHEAEIISRSLERLIERGLMVGFGRRTMSKWFIEAVQLTPMGRKKGRDLLGRQTQLPLK